MPVRDLAQLFSRRDLRNAILGFIVVFGGIGLALFTLYAHQTGNVRLAGVFAGLSLVFVLVILIFVVPPLARNASREASQMNLPFEFTTGGAVMLVLLMIVGFSAWNTGNNLLFIVLSFLIASLVVGFFAGRVCLTKLDIKMRFPDTVFAETRTPILVSLHNRKRFFPAFSVVAKVRGTERERSIADEDLKDILPFWIAERLGRPSVIRRTLSHFPYVGAKQIVDSTAEHIFPHRGRLIIKDFELSTKFPFGFFNHRRRLTACETELVVLPALVTINEDIRSTSHETGHFVTHKRGGGHDLLALRDYRPNDDLRHIDWKATARARSLTVREFAAEDDKQVTIILDDRLPRTDERTLSLRDKIEAEQSGESVVISERFERGVRLTASLVSMFGEDNASIRLVIGDDAGEFGNGRAHVHDCLRRLALANPRTDILHLDDESKMEIFGSINDQEKSHQYLVTANSTSLPPNHIDSLSMLEF